MALYHFSVRHVSRGKGQMVVASAAYISGQRIFDSYYNKIHDYTSCALLFLSTCSTSFQRVSLSVRRSGTYSGQRIFDSYYNKIHDYTSKSGVVFTEILTPEYVPERLTDRETLWNEVEHVERKTRRSLPIRLTLPCRMN